MRARHVGTALAAALLAPLAAAAQTPPPGQQARPGEVQVDLVIMREVFQYPAFQRRNPFVPVQGIAEGEVNPAELRLVGVIIARDPARSVAVVGNSIAEPAEDGSGMTITEVGDSYYLRIGESLGNIRLVEIHDDRIVVDIQQFGLTDRMTIPLLTGIPGGRR